MQQGRPGTPIVYYLFDLLELDGEPLVDQPLEERRERLEELLDPQNATVRLSAGRSTTARRSCSDAAKAHRSWRA